jgi:hypothetical protein
MTTPRKRRRAKVPLTRPRSAAPAWRGCRLSKTHRRAVNFKNLPPIQEVLIKSIARCAAQMAALSPPPCPA